MTAPRANVTIPVKMIDAARERYPELREVPLARLVRFMYAIALGKSRTEALEATRDARSLREYV